MGGAIGTTVTITGTRFSADASQNSIYLGAAKANVTAATATSPFVTVPDEKGNPRTEKLMITH